MAPVGLDSHRPSGYGCSANWEGRMPLVAMIAQIAVLFGGTIAIMVIDRKRRYSRSAPVVGEPELGTLVLLAVLCNFACLPYYFYKTRGGVGVVLGAVLFCVCFGASMVVGIGLRLLF